MDFFIDTRCNGMQGPDLLLVLNSISLVETLQEWLTLILLRKKTCLSLPMVEKSYPWRLD